ncbi:hypothetical protein ACQRIU_006820 [Beauveria bassiana]
MRGANIQVVHLGQDLDIRYHSLRRTLLLVPATIGRRRKHSLANTRLHAPLNLATAFRSYASLSCCICTSATRRSRTEFCSRVTATARASPPELSQGTSKLAALLLPVGASLSVSALPRDPFFVLS